MVDVYVSFSYKKGFLRRCRWIILLCIVCQGLLISQAHATHFRYGNLSWRQLPSDLSGRTIEFKLTMGFRLGYFSPTPTVSSTVSNTTANPSSAFNFGDGATISAFNFTVTSVNTGDDYFYGEATIVHSYTSIGAFSAYIESSARLSTLINNANGRYRIATTVNVGSTNLPPASTLPPIINLPFDQAAASFTIPATDPNGNTLTFSLATATDLGVTSYTFTQPTGFSLTTGGVATFDTRSPKAVGQLYNAIVKISDGQSFVVVDFLIRIVAASVPPVFVYGGITPDNNSTIQAYVGCPVNFNVRAADTDPTSNTLTVQGVGLPPGATFSPVTGSNTVTAPFSFTPTTEGTFVTSFFAQDNIGNQTLTSVTFRILQPLLTASPALACVGNTLSLTATPGTSASGVTTYSFRGPGGAIGSASTNNTTTVSGLAAGVYTFSVVTTNSLNSNTACTSTAVTSVTVESPPTVTLISSGTLTCAIPSIKLTANSSTTGISYAVSGPGLMQTGAASTATVTQSGTYTVVVNTASGCIASATTTVVSNTLAPAAPSISLVQPSCTLTTGTLSVTAPTGSGLTYSIDGVSYTNTSGTFAGVSAGIYPVTVRNSINGCISASTSVTVTAQPPTPATPTALVTAQPTCTVPTGTISITTPLGTGLTYSVNGSVYSSLPTFTGVSSGTYAVTVRNSSGCTSSATSVTVLLQPATPVLTSSSVSICAGLSTGLTVSGCSGGTLSWSTGSSTTAIVVAPVVTTVYTATCINTVGCSAVTSASATVRPSPTYTQPPQTTPAVCTGTAVSSAARIDFSTLQNTERADIVAGASYTAGPAYGAASNKLVASGNVSFTGLPNPATTQVYTIRLFSATGSCFTDISTTLDGVNCQCPANSCVKINLIH